MLFYYAQSTVAGLWFFSCDYCVVALLLSTEKVDWQMHVPLSPVCASAGVVKVRRGVVARYMIGLDAMPDLYRALHHFAQVIERRWGSHIPVDMRIITHCSPWSTPLFVF